MKKILLLVFVVASVNATITLPDWHLYAEQLKSELQAVTESLTSDVALFQQKIDAIPAQAVFTQVEGAIANAISCIRAKIAGLKSDLQTCNDDTSTIINSSTVELSSLRGQLESLRESTRIEITRLQGLRNTAQANLSELEIVYAQTTVGHEELAASFLLYAQDLSQKYDAMVLKKALLLDKINSLLSAVTQHNTKEMLALTTVQNDLCIQQ